MVKRFDLAHAEARRQAGREFDAYRALRNCTTHPSRLAKCFGILNLADPADPGSVRELVFVLEALGKSALEQAEAIRDGNALDDEAKREALKELAAIVLRDGLQAILQAERVDISSRDCHPDNLLLPRDLVRGRRATVTLVDFDHAWVASGAAETDGMTHGLDLVTPLDVLRGERPCGLPDEAYAVAVSAFVIATGGVETPLVYEGSGEPVKYLRHVAHAYRSWRLPERAADRLLDTLPNDATTDALVATLNAILDGHAGWRRQQVASDGHREQVRNIVESHARAMADALPQASDDGASEVRTHEDLRVEEALAELNENHLLATLADFAPPRVPLLRRLRVGARTRPLGVWFATVVPAIVVVGVMVALAWPWWTAHTSVAAWQLSKIGGLHKLAMTVVVLVALAPACEMLVREIRRSPRQRRMTTWTARMVKAFYSGIAALLVMVVGIAGLDTLLLGESSYVFTSVRDSAAQSADDSTDVADASDASLACANPIAGVPASSIVCIEDAADTAWAVASSSAQGSDTDVVGEGVRAVELSNLKYECVAASVSASQNLDAPSEHAQAVAGDDRVLVPDGERGTPVRYGSGSRTWESSTWSDGPDDSYSRERSFVLTSVPDNARIRFERALASVEGIGTTDVIVQVVEESCNETDRSAIDADVFVLLGAIEGATSDVVDSTLYSIAAGDACDADADFGAVAQSMEVPLAADGRPRVLEWTDCVWPIYLQQGFDSGQIRSLQLALRHQPAGSSARPETEEPYAWETDTWQAWWTFEDGADVPKWDGFVIAEFAGETTDDSWSLVLWATDSDGNMLTNDWFATDLVQSVAQGIKLFDNAPVDMTGDANAS
ncbi:hypothetical protein QQX13_02460 [Demequina sp. SYSU T00068]|uniref:hypothetical protein n=1 Tax=Demequina lignilytica TaxID=3051663 RepID=UPI0026061D36|nr:hypothetical protein [Demequina sp. SYSU T00068]MDN4489687.1 hypothetical protein [Demequina sp. SYSU T00068]